MIEEFYCKNKHIYPPFKNGLYLEEYFLQFIQNNINTKRKYIPALWTNFQIELWFPQKKDKMQESLNNWIKDNPSSYGYFTIVQHADGNLLSLPENTIVYGGSKGDNPIPLIYEDINNTLESLPKKKFKDKKILCSFVGNITVNNVMPNVRQIMFDKFMNNDNFIMLNSGGWTPNINQNLQEIFIDTTLDSKFTLAPRGYGRSSFRFFEAFLLGTIPIYIWNDIKFLPFQNIIDYSQLCICIHISEIDSLESILLSINEEKYNQMFEYYKEIKYLFELEGFSKQVIKEMS